ncbi:hypothetical protein KSD_34250 [Ktedonobacter sp. SOSP1-85]|uniref:hypothetical protein n=1 Tax=Ktedonobacter sp. SOSP1-85 TaxID=2778367 RepID=UPI0019152876|nr:hypothetical protein [Ktedonobacter sp. SOSP1-85]GHO75654.1 hypothetical protein KSD_34250 [Ktedonobacter sp. SOSP1-85]
MYREVRENRRRHTNSHRQPFTGFALSLFLLLLLASCGSAQAATTTTETQHIVKRNAPATTKTIALGAQPCPTTAASTDYWSAVVGIQREKNSIAKVSCGHLEGNDTLQTLVEVDYNGASGGVKDIYVYDQITGPAPTKILELKDLYQGDARISGYNTVITREVDWNSSVNKGQSSDSVQRDLYREFKWAPGANGMLPVAFRGFYPDLTRYQAETDQQQVSKSHEQWKLDPRQVAQHMASNLLNWSGASQASILKQQGVDATISLKNAGQDGGTITVTLSRLEGRSDGIWLVTQVDSDALLITQPTPLDHLARNFTLTGKGPTGVSGQVKVFDHLYNEIGSASTTSAGNGATTFHTPVSYTPTFDKGSEDGILALFVQKGNAIQGAVMFKALLG